MPRVCACACACLASVNQASGQTEPVVSEKVMLIQSSSEEIFAVPGYP